MDNYRGIDIREKVNGYFTKVGIALTLEEFAEVVQATSDIKIFGMNKKLALSFKGDRIVIEKSKTFNGETKNYKIALDIVQFSNMVAFAKDVLNAF